MLSASVSMRTIAVIMAAPSGARRVVPSQSLTAPPRPRCAARPPASRAELLQVPLRTVHRHRPAGSVRSVQVALDQPGAGSFKPVGAQRGLLVAGRAGGLR